MLLQYYSQRECYKIKIVQLLHFLRLHQIIYQLTLVLSILIFQHKIDFFELMSCLVLILLITPTFLLIQDFLGKKDDENFNQKRILFSERFNIFFLCFNLAIQFVILLLNNISSVFCYGLLFASTIGYGTAKHFRKMVLSYTFRYLSSVFTILLFILILTETISEKYYLFILFVSGLDLVGNIAGDIRDSEKDLLAGIKTLLTTKGRQYTLMLMLLIVSVSFSTIIIYYKSSLIIGLFFCNLLLFLLIGSIPDKFVHGIFHLGKLINFLSISFIINNFSVISFATILVCIIFVWIISYYFYLNSSGLHSHD